ncbi:hypothetical protein RD792_015930 [Penstemon davidsonii]|uniref:MADS-box domain-containing protein n=1 Tax=Penstemon davidsonii TaxID=160366 RepID=A0ABR0CJ64_9LAMI|nr:hypothetical protein RD792_015930 [Penstemon davidsonii]
MTRKKVNLAFIANDSARKATFKKRKKGLMKKITELSTLCGVDACAVVYSPYQPHPDVWPPDPRAAQHVVTQFKRMPEMEQSKKMMNQESFIRQRITKAAEQLKKVQRENREKEMTELMYKCLMGRGGVQGLGVGELNDMGWLIDERLKEISKRIDEGLKKGTGGAVAEKKAEVVDLGGGVERQQHWPFAEWMGSTSAGEEIMLQFNEGNNQNQNHNNNNAAVMWSNAFFH